MHYAVDDEPIQFYFAENENFAYPGRWTENILGYTYYLSTIFKDEVFYLTWLVLLEDGTNRPTLVESYLNMPMRYSHFNQMCQGMQDLQESGDYTRFLNFLREFKNWHSEMKEQVELTKRLDRLLNTGDGGDDTENIQERS